MSLSFPGLGLNGCHRDGSLCESRQHDSSNVLFTLKLAGIASALPHPIPRRYTTSLAFEVRRQGIIELRTRRAGPQLHSITLWLVSGLCYARPRKPLFPNCALPLQSGDPRSLERWSFWEIFAFIIRVSEHPSVLYLVQSCLKEAVRRGDRIVRLPPRDPERSQFVRVSALNCDGLTAHPYRQTIQTQEFHLLHSSHRFRFTFEDAISSSPPVEFASLHRARTQDTVDSRIPPVDRHSGERLPLGLISLSSTRAVDHSQRVRYLNLVRTECSSVTPRLVSGYDIAFL
ncbi:hypothetical protein NMY22_g621 [Coprinellus aureogranulatus]|nr:hypothetical protein NMY22_g621 [Coprinellus aureogranulatus]